MQGAPSQLRTTGIQRPHDPLAFGLPGTENPPRRVRAWPGAMAFYPLLSSGARTSAMHDGVRGCCTQANEPVGSDGLVHMGTVIRMDPFSVVYSEVGGWRGAMRKAKTHKLSDVFGISRDVPLNYVTRTKVDDVLVDSLTRDKHIVIFGSSKQGKTCLRKYNLKVEDYIVVTCSNRGDLGQLHSQMLKEAGYTVALSTTQTIGGNRKISATFTAKGKAPLVGEVDASVDGGAGKDTTTTSTFKPLELDPFDPNDIIRALREIEFNGFIVLEDFHYLPDETQTDFAVALKAFHENSSYSFIVVGV